MHSRPYLLSVLVAVLLAAIAPLPSATARPPSPANQTERDVRLVEANRLLQQAVQQIRTSEFAAALPALEQALEIYQQTGERSREGMTLLGLGRVYDELDRYPQALEYYEQALTIFQDLGERSEEGTTLSNMGVVYDAIGQYPQALDYHQQALTIAREQSDRFAEGRSLNNMAMTHNNLGQFSQAIEHYQQALVIVQELEDAQARRGEGEILNNIGLAYSNIGQYEQALEYLLQSLTIRQEVGDRSGEGRSLNNTALVHHETGQYEQSLQYLQQALVIRRAIGDRSGEASTLNNFGGVYNSLGQHPQALEYYQQALAIYQEIGDRAGEGSALNNIGSTYRQLGEDDQGLEYYQQALAIRQEIGDRNGEGDTLNNIGQVYDDLKQYSQALEYHRQALAIRREIGDRDGEATSLNNIGFLYRKLGQPAQALDYVQQSLTILRDIGNRQSEQTALGNIGALLIEQDQPELAIVFLKRAVNVIEQIRSDNRGLSHDLQQSYTETVTSTYRRLADLLLQQDRVIEAQRVLDLLKVQELDDYLRGVQRNAQTETGIIIRPEEQEALRLFTAQQNQLVTLGRELRELEQIAPADRTPQQRDRILELRQLEAAARQQFREFFESEEVARIVAQLRQTTGAANLELTEFNDLRDNLQQLEQAVILYPLVLDDRLELVLVTADAPPIRRTVNVRREDLNRAIVEFRSALQSPTSDAITPAQQLYDWLIRPLEADLVQANANTLIYSPDGQLRYVPLAALHDGNQWLAQRFQVNNITAASLDDLNSAPSQEEELSVLAAAFTEGQYSVSLVDRTLSFLGLQYAGQEVANLAALIPQTVERLNADFNANIVYEMNDYRIVHLATHATFNPGPPENSFILFGNGDRATLAQIKDWSFPNVDLIVLSACETAVGDVPLGNGEEILGFGYLMQLAGADAAIASLWSVSDGGTQILMDAFYAALNQGYTKAEALQQAQMALITGDASIATGERNATIQAISLRTGLPVQVSNNLDHPYYWAPFILIGNGL